MSQSGNNEYWRQGGNGQWATPPAGNYGRPPYGPPQGQPPYGYGPYMPPNPPVAPPSKTGPTVLTILSGLGLLASPLVFALMMGVGIAMYADSTLTTSEVHQNESIELDEHKTFLVDPDVYDSGDDMMGIDCRATRDGEPFELTRIEGDAASEPNRGKFKFKNHAEHIYTIVCEEDGTPLEYVHLRRTELEPTDVLFTIPVALAVLFAFLSLAGLIVGIVWLAKRTSQHRRYMATRGW